jgi:hypothetical protein
MSCAQCEGIETQFGRAAAKRNLRRFRRRGPDKTTRLLIDALRAALEDSKADGATLLDIGASSAHLAAAREETERRGHDSRVEFVHGDFVSIADEVVAADVVTLDRVICCFDDMEGLVSRSAEKARRLYGAVYPRELGWMRIGMAIINVVQRLKRSPFRVFLHRPSAIDAVLRAAGFERRTIRRSPGWEVVVYERHHGASR